MLGQWTHRQRHLIYCLLASFLVASCGLRESNFSQFPGFDNWYANNPPATQKPDSSTMDLLVRYQPRLFVADSSGKPIRFYEDYIANGYLTDGQGKQVSNAVSSVLLNQYRLDPRVAFTHQPAPSSSESEAIVRVDLDRLPSVDGKPARELLFLTYHFVFAQSGVAAGIRAWQQTLIGLIADPADWHQLDHYTAVTVALDATSKRPLAVLLQQHNYMRSWLLGKREGPGVMVLPKDDRVAVVAAVRSNELYRWQAGRQLRRAVPGMSADNVHWLVHGTSRPWMTADDITNPELEIQYSLNPLPPSDAFFVFNGWLGERRQTPGRDGPPGADFNTIPALKSRALQLAAFHWYEGDDDYVDQVQSWPSDSRPQRKHFAKLVERFTRKVNALED